MRGSTIGIEVPQAKWSLSTPAASYLGTLAKGEHGRVERWFSRYLDETTKDFPFCTSTYKVRLTSSALVKADSCILSTLCVLTGGIRKKLGTPLVARSNKRYCRSFERASTPKELEFNSLRSSTTLPGCFACLIYKRPPS